MSDKKITLAEDATSGLTYDEIQGSATGFDEIAAEKTFGHGLYDRTKPVMRVRALIFVHKLHTGAKPAEAKAFALGLPVSQVDTYFGNDVEDEAADPTMPAGTPAGNDSE